MTTDEMNALRPEAVYAQIDVEAGPVGKGNGQMLCEIALDPAVGVQSGRVFQVDLEGVGVDHAQTPLFQVRGEVAGAVGEAQA